MAVAKSSVKPLSPKDIKILHGGSLLSFGLFSKGHHDENVFLENARLKHGKPLRILEPVAHEWWRAVPDPDGVKYLAATPGSRGAFKVTFVVRLSEVPK